MAIYHLSVGFVSRSTGRSAVQAAAYISGENLHESRRALNVNYQNRHSDIAYSATLAPDFAPDKFKNLNVWDLLESFEDKYAIERFPNSLEAREKYLNSAQSAMSIVSALPYELSVENSKELVEEFANTRFVSRRLIVSYAIHDDEGNPHAHFLISRRSVNENGELSWAKDRLICTKSELLYTRKLWADLSNKYLEREGFEARITEKSFLDLGIELIPSKHRGWVSDKLEGMGIASRIQEENVQTFNNNRESVLENPNIILNEITSKQATFTQTQLLKNIQKRIGDDSSLIASVFEKSLNLAEIAGEGIDGQIRYTSSAYKEIEEKAITTLDGIMGKSFEQKDITQSKVQNLINRASAKKIFL